MHQIVLSTAHPAKFSDAVTDSLSSAKVPFDFEKDVLPKEMVGLLQKERRVESVYLTEGASSSSQSESVVDKLARGTRTVIERYAQKGTPSTPANTQSV